MVYYRTYRPQTIAELDSPKLRETLYAVLGSKNIPHAYLFTGPKGLGKTSTARIIAKVLNCEHIDKGKGESGKGKEEIEPDNTCDQCVSITNGSNIDVLEIDGASNRGIDEIRDLRDKVKLAPSSAKKKVYIIDEVHMLTTEAFNALLKTIEEPPSHVVFIFCTTEPQKVPATIISRCFHISLARATDEELLHSLKRIVAAEKIAIDDDALALIAHLGDGGFRDTQKLFEEVVALSGGQTITKAMVEDKTHVSRSSYFVTHILESLAAKDATSALQTVEESLQQGTDMKYLLTELLSALHDVILAKVGVSTPNSSPLAPDSFSIGDLQSLVGYLQEAYQHTKFAVVASLPLELAIIAYCSGTDSTTVISNEVRDLSQKEISRSTRNDKGETSSLAKDTGKHTLDTLLTKERNLKVQQVLGKILPPKKPKKEEPPHTQGDLQNTATFMENLIYKVKPFNHSVAGVLRGCVISTLDDGKIVFVTPYKFHKEKLEEAKTRDILEKGVREIVGKPLQVMVELKA